MHSTTLETHVDFVFRREEEPLAGIAYFSLRRVSTSMLLRFFLVTSGCNQVNPAQRK